MSDNASCDNTDREIWREREGDFYADSIHVTKAGGIGFNCGGHVIVMSPRNWHRIAQEYLKTLEMGQPSRAAEPLDASGSYVGSGSAYWNKDLEGR